MGSRRTYERGQATVEAAFLIPVLLLTLMLLIQPAILLYTRMVMESAASEACRILATEGSFEGNVDTVDDFILRRLASVPQQENFHVHEPDCTWLLTRYGNERTTSVTVEISNEARPLPLFDFALGALGVLNENGNFQFKVEHHYQTKPYWIENSPAGEDPKHWIEQWTNS